MKKITTRQVMMTFIGIYLGASFVSGQEIYQFLACLAAMALRAWLWQCLCSSSLAV